MPAKKVAAISIAAFLLYAERQRKNDNPPIFYRKKLVGNYNGYAFPFGIFIKESERNNKMLLEHELIHWRQFQENGFIPFLISYAIEALTKGYDNNPYEIEARLLSGEQNECLLNYTNCVRSGTAATVQNKNFRL
mgnify:CR=1 FL=1